MPVPLDPADTVDRFARISALLADPFADRPAVLSDAGLDAAVWRAMEERWAERLQEPGGEDLARRFGEVFAATLSALTLPALDIAEPPATLPSGPPPAPSPPPPRHPLAGTVGVDASVLRPALPFADAAPSRVNPLGDTLEAGTRLPVPILPFTKR